MPEVLRFAELQPYLLLKNGNYLYKIPCRGAWAVLKVYFDSRNPLQRLRKSVANVLYSGQTSYQPRTRRRIERECMELWKAQGFRVFEPYDDVVVEAPGCLPGGYMVMEYAQAPKLLHILKDGARPADERFALYRRFLAEWGRRHELAERLREPRLVHENGDLNHVMVLGEGDSVVFLWFDFEMVYRFPWAVRQYVAHEIVQYIWDAHKNLPEELRDRFLRETISGYPDRARLLHAYEHFFHHPNPVLRLARWVDRRFRKRAQKPTSKYKVVAKLRECIERV